LKVDLHVHTRHSHDAFISPKTLVACARRKGIDAVAITDHNTVKGLREFCKIEEILIIPGVEVETLEGHVLALNVTDLVESGLSIAETADKIQDAGGLAIAAHPTVLFKRSLEVECAGDLDAIEVINSAAVPFSFSVRKNRELAEKLNLPQTGGSDAHCGPEIGLAYSSIDGEGNIDSICEAIQRGAVTPFGRSISLTMRLKRQFMRIRKILQ
jgi:predicted metal-dependent phosphoesterase TrpH